MNLDRLALSYAAHAATHGTCALRRVGAVLVVRGVILMPGHNGRLDGASCGHENYLDPREDPGLEPAADGYRCALATHAEVRALEAAKALGVNRGGSSLYVTCRPCLRCAERIAAAGVGEVVLHAGWSITRELRERLGPTAVRFV